MKIKRWSVGAGMDCGGCSPLVQNLKVVLILNTSFAWNNKAAV